MVKDHRTNYETANVSGVMDGDLDGHRCLSSMETTTGKSKVMSGKQVEAGLMNKKILIVDDEPSIVTLLTYNLNEAGFQVESVGSGLQALAWLRTKQADLIVMDLMLPGIDGLEAIRRIRGTQEETPIIILTAKNNELDKIIGFEIGADDYLTNHLVLEN